MPYRKTFFARDLKKSVKILKEEKRYSHHLIFFTYEDINYLFGYSYGEETPPFLIKETEGKYVIFNKYSYTTKTLELEIIGSLIPINFNFGISIDDFLKKYIKKEEIQDNVEEKEVKKKRKYTRKPKTNEND